MKPQVLATVLLLVAAPAWAINKCKGPDGKVRYQEAPCAEDRLNPNGYFKFKEADSIAWIAALPKTWGLSKSKHQQISRCRLLIMHGIPGLPL